MAGLRGQSHGKRLASHWWYESQRKPTADLGYLAHMIEYTIDEAEHLILARMSGANGYLDLVRLFSRLLTDPKFDRSYSTIFQISEDATFPIVLLKQSLGAIVGRYAERQKQTKWAVVSSSHSQLSIARLATDAFTLKSVRMQFFDNEECARDWLSSDGNHQP